MGAVVSCIQSIFRSIGACLNAIVSGIANILKAIINGIASVFMTIISCLTCGKAGRRRTTTTSRV
ncbi:hypothetical protein BDZ85DRAFT_189418 [Elsinoe ampelina]|uniref:Uncharacterized protein n=2 Tax=Elsinoe TaxID=40996 RepID=A0A8K0L3A2_9PEZI|nr:hypothetical protein BDZ85DRAFT_189418 [Elsinoe ampelina]KAG8629141.1 hypothetical protein KVT40_003006 [Elsinoe batatas]